MRTTKEGLDLIKSCEGLRLKAYPDPATGGDPWTIGYGHTGGVKPTDVITAEKAEELLLQDILKFEKGVSSLLKTNITDNQFSALVSFAFNLGLGNLQTSTLLKLLNSGKFKEAADQFPRWNKANGKEMAGLTKRRNLEKQLFLKG